MFKYRFPAIFKKISKDSYSVHFYDIKELKVDGDTYLKAIENAREALKYWQHEAICNNTEIPTPNTN
jgi:predicted RNase H-like HicB family nuclease